MTDATPIYAFPFPEDTDAPDGPGQFEALALAVETSLNDHVTDTSGAHAASAISFTPTGNIASSTVQAAIAEVDSETDARLDVIEGAWTDYTPSIAGMSIGNGTVVARKRQVGKTMDYRIHITAGSTTSGSSTIAIGLPAQPKSDYVSVGDPMGSGWLSDSSAGTSGRYGAQAIYWNTGTNGSVFLMQGNTTVSMTAPFTVATGDQWAAAGTYELP